MSIQSVTSIINQGLTYKQQLQDPRWIAFRKLILEQRNFCECCRQSGKVLQVHHLFYEPDRMLWEYESSEVIVLCWNCHMELHRHLKNFRKYIFRYLSPGLFQMLNGCLAVGLEKYKPEIYMRALAEFTASERLVENYAKAWGFDTAASAKRPVSGQTA